MKLPIYIFAKYDDYEKKYRFHAWGYDMTGSDVGVLVEKREVSFDPPPHSALVEGTIAEYKETQKKIVAEAEKKRNEIQQKINDLLCLENKA